MWSALLDLHVGAQVDDGLGRREAQSWIGHEGGEVGQRHAEVEVALLVGRARVTRLFEQGLAFARVGAGSKHAC